MHDVRILLQQEALVFGVVNSLFVLRAGERFDGIPRFPKRYQCELGLAAAHPAQHPYALIAWNGSIFLQAGFLQVFESMCLCRIRELLLARYERSWVGPPIQNSGRMGTLTPALRQPGSSGKVVFSSARGGTLAHTSIKTPPLPEALYCNTGRGRLIGLGRCASCGRSRATYGSAGGSPGAVQPGSTCRH
jgi:hypothetical protein